MQILRKSDKVTGSWVQRCQCNHLGGGSDPKSERQNHTPQACVTHLQRRLADYPGLSASSTAQGSDFRLGPVFPITSQEDIFKKGTAPHESLSHFRRKKKKRTSLRPNFLSYPTSRESCLIHRQYFLTPPSPPPPKPHKKPCHVMIMDAVCSGLLLCSRQRMPCQRHFLSQLLSQTSLDNSLTVSLCQSPLTHPFLPAGHPPKESCSSVHFRPIL